MEHVERIKIAEYSINILSVLGFWRPKSLKSCWQIRLYTIYGAFGFTFNYFFATTLLINLCQNVQNPEVYIENIFFFTTMCLISIKVTYINIYREDIISLIDMFLQKHCLPRNKNEAEIVNKCKEKERFTERLIVISTLFITTLYLLWPLMNTKNVSLPIKSWIPYNINSRKRFWITYLYQAIAIFYLAIQYTSTETLLTILIHHMCSQLEILTFRFFEIANLRKKPVLKFDIYEEECKLMKQCVDHHVYIFSIEKQLNDIFGFFVSLQFFVSVLNLCTSGFYLTKVNPTGAYFWFSGIMICCFILQILTNCYFGEEMTNKSLSIVDEIYKMNWSSLTLQTKQKLIMIIMRASHPIQLTGASLVVLSIETFFKVLKASYSSYNLLRNSN